MQRTSYFVCAPLDLFREAERMQKNGWVVTGVRPDVDKTHALGVQIVYAGHKAKEVQAKFYPDVVRL